MLVVVLELQKALLRKPFPVYLSCIIARCRTPAHRVKDLLQR